MKLRHNHHTQALVKELLGNPKWTTVTTIGRSPLDLTGHANVDKLKQVTVCNVLRCEEYMYDNVLQIDMKDGYEPASNAFEGHDAVFCCLGMVRIHSF